MAENTTTLTLTDDERHALHKALGIAADEVSASFQEAESEQEVVAVTALHATLVKLRERIGDAQ